MKSYSFAIVSLFIINFSFGQVDTTESQEDFFSMSLEELMGTTITSVSKKEERLHDVSSSIYVLTSEDIAHSSANNLHELLMQVPGYWGTQEEFNRVVQANVRMSLTENSFNGSVLYLLDGTPLQDVLNSYFSFENFDLPLSDIERIEVIRGSGGTIYGANSATGVVSIYTKSPDKYKNKINASVVVGSPTLISAQLNGGLHLTDKLSVGYYGKVRQFNGYGLIDELKGDSVTVPKSDGSGMTTIKNRFTEDFEKTLMTAFGLKLKYAFNEGTSLTINTHFNDLRRNQYTNAYLPSTLFQTDELFYNENKKMRRFVGNVKFDKELNENNSFFLRYSTNIENSFNRFAGGVAYDNSIHDLEFHYNLSKNRHNISVGANYRFVELNISDRNSPEIITFNRYKANENLKGVFIQDQVNLVKDKLTATIGVKAENYTLVNDEFYLSPNVRLAYMPNKEVTIWGAVSQSYTTPAYTQTDLTYDLFQGASQQVFENGIRQGSYDAVYAQVYAGIFQGAKAQGASDAQATAAADAQVESRTDLTIKGLAAQQAQKYPGNYNRSITNGENTVPTRFTNYEIGARANVTKELYAEINASYTQFVDGVTNTPTALFKTEQDHPTEEGEKADLIYYGNYLKGQIFSMENMVRIKPVDELSIELSHTLVLSDFEYQENDDFDKDALPEELKEAKPSTSIVPEHVFRLKVLVFLPQDFTLSVNGLTTSKYQSQNVYQYDVQNFQPSHITSGTTLAGENDNRTIFNLKLSKSFKDKKCAVFAFANDVFNTGRVETTRPQFQTTISQTYNMYGLGMKASF